MPVQYYANCPTHLVEVFASVRPVADEGRWGSKSLVTFDISGLGSKVSKLHSILEYCNILSIVFLDLCSKTPASARLWTWSFQHTNQSEVKQNQFQL
jgi:hypothetical protein